MFLESYFQELSLFKEKEGLAFTFECKGLLLQKNDLFFLSLCLSKFLSCPITYQR